MGDEVKIFRNGDKKPSLMIDCFLCGNVLVYPFVRTYSKESGTYFLHEECFEKKKKKTK